MQTTPDPAGLLVELLDACSAGRVPSLAARRWLCDSVATAMRGQRLEVAMGLAGRGKRTLATRLQQARRDAMLVEAVRFSGLTSTTWWARCQQLAPALSRYVAGAWRVDRLRNDPPTGELWRVYAWHALRIDEDVPTSSRALYDAVQRVRGISPHDLPGTIAFNLEAPRECLTISPDSLYASPDPSAPAA